jgi:hypothetical protein
MRFEQAALPCSYWQAQNYERRSMMSIEKDHTRRRRQMQRLTITVDDDLVADVDEFIAARGYANRSEAIRDLSAAVCSNPALKWPAAATASRP